MELRQLRYFVAAAQAEHFARAASQLHVVPSALSSAIQSLEAELDTKLFVRTTRRVRLTSAGRTFLDKAEAVLAAADSARRSVQDVAQEETGTLTIGSVHGLPAFLDLPAILAEFHDAYPRIEVRLVQDGAIQLLEKLRAGTVDLAFMPEAGKTEGIATTLVASETLMVVSSLSHQLKGSGPTTLQTVGKFSFVDFQPDWGMRAVVDDAFRKAGVQRKTVFEVSDINTLFELVSRDLGIALVPESMACVLGSEIWSCGLAEADIDWEVVVAHMEETRYDPASSRFLDLLVSQDIIRMAAKRRRMRFPNAA